MLVFYNNLLTDVIANYLAYKVGDDFEELFRFLYDESNQYLPNKEGTVAILVNEHQYKANFRIDKEINTMSLIQNLIENK